MGNNLGDTIGNIIAKSYSLLKEIHPDALLVLGDTNSSLCTISAKRLKIPIFHLEAGNRCFDENLPEEINRRIVDHISDINLAYSEHARRNLLAEGCRKEYTFVVGSPIAEVLSANESKIKNSDAVFRFNLTPKKYILLSAHREENIDNETNFFELMNTINDIAVQFKMKVIYSTHPRSRKFIDSRKFKFHSDVCCLEPFGFTDYIQLQTNAFCVVSDSGTLPEECSYFNFPAVSIRTSTERPEALEKGNFVIGSISSDSVISAINTAVNMNQHGDIGSKVPDYIEKNMSSKVVNIIQSYKDIVNRMIWRKF